MRQSSDTDRPQEVAATEQTTNEPPELMPWPALGHKRHLLEAAVQLVLGDLPAHMRRHAEEALCLARAYCTLSDVERSRSFEFVVNDATARTHNPDSAARQEPRLLALYIAEMMDCEPFTREDDPGYSVARDAERVYGLSGAALAAYLRAAEVLRALPAAETRSGPHYLFPQESE